MPLHQKVFLSATFFLAGVTLASLLTNLSQLTYLSGRQVWWLVISWGFIFAVFLVFRRFALLPFIIFGLLGSSYYFYIDMTQIKRGSIFNAADLHADPVSFRALVVDNRISAESQRVDVKLENSELKLRLNLAKYPRLRYGDLLYIEGIVKPVPPDRIAYYRKERIAGLMSYPEIKIIVHDRGNKFLAGLYKFRDNISEAYHSVLPDQKARFLTGLTLGKSAGFSKDFQEKLNKTGTAHLVALSGYNITILAKYFFSFLLIFLARRRAFIVSIMAIILFVIMTGAEASVVRAGIMGIILLIATQSGRLHSIKQAVVVAAFGMTLFNPYLLIFDIGFQLSFAAFLGIAYLKPAIEKFFRFETGKSFLNWRENLTTTLSAQLAVLPLLLMSFGYISLTALIPNILILTFVPLTMLFGLLIFIFGLAAHFLASAAALIANLFLSYELGVIELFSKFSLGLNIKNFSIVFAIIYYAAIIGFILYNKKYVRETI